MFFIAKDQGSRNYMEDEISIEHSLFNNFHYYAVFDGHGTGEVSAFLRDNMKVVVKDELVNLKIYNHETIIDALASAFKKIVDIIPQNISRFAGSTVVIALKFKQHLWIANCGDSRAIMNSLLHSIQISKDHKPTREDEYKRIISYGGKVFKTHALDVPRVNGQLALSRAIGDFDLYPHVTWKPEVYYSKLTSKNKFIYIATDGIWDVLDNQQVVDIINQHMRAENLANVGEHIIIEARKKGSTDNIAMVLILI
jgi:serine/threonine protein phosphatase PrpC